MDSLMDARGRADNQPLEKLSSLVPGHLHDAFLRQLFTFSAGTLKAIAALVLLVSYAALRTIIVGLTMLPRCFAMIRNIFTSNTVTVEESPTTAVVIPDDSYDEMTDVTAEDGGDDTACAYTGPESIANFYGNPWESPSSEADTTVTPLTAVEQAHVEAFAPESSSPFDGNDGRTLFIAVEQEAFAPVAIPASDSCVPLIVVEQAHVEASAPVSGSPLGQSNSEYLHPCESNLSTCLSTKSFSGIIAQDSFNWDQHASFRCSTPVSQQAEISFEVEGSQGSYSARDISESEAAAEALQAELAQTRRHLDMIVEARIKQVEESAGIADPLDVYIQSLANVSPSHHHLSFPKFRMIYVVLQRSLDTSTWADATTPETSSCQSKPCSQRLSVRTFICFL
jgi:hypothetical protein